jgi:outer membrane protein OmpA-like peptidoglycan-associated protein
MGKYSRLPAVFVIGFTILIGPVWAGEPQTSLIFFGKWSALIEPEAEATILHAGEMAKENMNAVVTVTGYADMSASEAAGKLLSQLRTQVVAEKLMEDGVSFDRIVQKAEGPVAANGEKQESRRVNITVGE